MLQGVLAKSAPFVFRRATGRAVGTGLDAQHLLGEWASLCVEDFQSWQTMTSR